MIVFPNCKINLGLKVLRKREDGYHDLETIFYPIKITDALEIITSPNIKQPPAHLVHFETTGSPVGGDPTDNLCVKAYHLLKTDFPSLPPVTIHLHKNIPIGAGLGGGSADGAFTLLLLNEKYNLNLTKSRLIEYAVQLGSDCPFFIINKPCFATSRGEVMQEISLDLSAFTIIMVNPGIHINTGWAFSDIQPAETGTSLELLIKEPLSSWQQQVQNDFELPVFRKYPEIKNIKDYLGELGAIFTSMSGSGSTVFGIFDLPILPTFPPHYKVVKISPAASW